MHFCLLLGSLNLNGTCKIVKVQNSAVLTIYSALQLHATIYLFSLLQTPAFLNVQEYFTQILFSNEIIARKKSK